MTEKERIILVRLDNMLAHFLMNGDLNKIKEKITTDLTVGELDQILNNAYTEERKAKKK